MAADREVVVDVDSAKGVADHLKKIGFHEIDEHPERLQSVPRLRIVRVPKTVKSAWRENVSLRKSVFYRLALSAVLQVNEDILTQRVRLQSFSINEASDAERAWVSAMMTRYGLVKLETPLTAKFLAALLLRVDVLPPSLVIVQGAIESGWLQSRFARKGQAIFGQWTSGSKGIKALGSDVHLAAFANPRDSLVAYMLNLNTHPAYAALRNARAEIRRAGRQIDGDTLAGFMGHYAETGQEYVNLIRRMIRRDGLARADSARLASGPRILFRRLDQR